MGGDRSERHRRVLGAVQTVETPEYINVTKIHLEGVSAQRPLPTLVCSQTSRISSKLSLGSQRPELLPDIW